MAYPKPDRGQNDARFADVFGNVAAGLGASISQKLHPRWQVRAGQVSKHSCSSPQLSVEVRIEDANLGDSRDRQLVTGRGAAHGLRRGPVIDAERMLAIGCDVGMYPRNTVLGVVVDDLTAKIRAALVLRDAEAIRKFSSIR